LLCACGSASLWCSGVVNSARFDSAYTCVQSVGGMSASMPDNWSICVCMCVSTCETNGQSVLTTMERGGC
jgi:hypothetical protein